jgi:hypothetical protein
MLSQDSPHRQDAIADHRLSQNIPGDLNRMYNSFISQYLTWIKQSHGSDLALRYG